MSFSGILTWSDLNEQQWNKLIFLIFYKMTGPSGGSLECFYGSTCRSDYHYFLHIFSYFQDVLLIRYGCIPSFTIFRINNYFLVILQRYQRLYQRKETYMIAALKISVWTMFVNLDRTLRKCRRGYLYMIIY